MNRRLVLATVALGLLVTGISGSAFAQTTSRHKLCVELLDHNPSDPNQAGYCVSWEDPTQP